MKPRRAYLFLVTCGGALVGIPSRSIASPGSSGSPIASGDLVVYTTQKTGTTALSTSTAQVLLSEFAPGSAASGPVQQIAVNSDVPTGSGPGTQYSLTDSGVGTTDGEISLSPNGQYLSLAGMNVATLASSTTYNSTTTPVSRTIGLFDVVNGGTVDTSTSLTNAYIGSNIRGVTTVDGSAFYAVGTQASGQSGTDGIIYAVKGSTTGTQIASHKDYSIQVYNNQLYVVDDGQSTNGVYAVPNQNGSLPMSAVATGSFTPIAETSVKLNGITATTNPEGFSLLHLNSASGSDPDTVYVADSVDGAVEKFTYSSGSTNGFVLTGYVSIPSATGLTAQVTPNGVQLYVTSDPTSLSSATPSQIFSLLDTSGYGNTMNGTPTVLYTAPITEDLKGIVLVPEPSMACVAVLGLATLRKRRRARAV